MLCPDPLGPWHILCAHPSTHELCSRSPGLQLSRGLSVAYVLIASSTLWGGKASN